jgi:hypothetical protein
MMDYTIEMYSKLCEIISNSNYKVSTIRNCILSSNLNDHTLILRHDVDGDAEDAIRMANVENKYGFQSTYYFRKKPQSFKPDIIKKVEQMGHEVGYHYETLNDTDGDFEQAFDLFKKNLALFREFCNVETVCAHGNPFKEQDNGDIWDKYDFKELGIIGEAYKSINIDNYFNISDAGGSWNNIFHTSNFIDIIKKDFYPVIYALVHTNNWTSDYISWLFNRSHTILPHFLQNNFNKFREIFTKKG